MIYKNLLRDFRKFFVLDFNQTTEYIKKKRRQEPRFYIHCLRMYLIDKHIKFEKNSRKSPALTPRDENSAGAEHDQAILGPNDHDLARQAK